MTDFKNVGWSGYQVKVITSIEDFDVVFELQEWCQTTVGENWATTPPEWNRQVWYFVNEADATMFILRWNQYVTQVDK